MESGPREEERVLPLYGEGLVHGVQEPERRVALGRILEERG